MKLRMDEILESTGGRLVRGSGEGSGEGYVTGVSTDSRTIRRGELFVALRGPRFDGHHYIGQAARRGAAAALVDRAGRFPARRVVRVADTLRALGDLAAAWRRRFPIPVVAVTGSNGKTTTKEMIAGILATRFRVLKTEGNFNNLIGMPLTLFRLRPGHEVAVLEMGMNAPGEIRRLAEIAAPEVGVITNVGRAHLEGLKSVAGVARAKGELLEKLPADGLAVVNGDDRWSATLASLARAPVVRFGLGPGNEVRASRVLFDDLKGLSFRVRLEEGSAPFWIPALGLANVTNALAAIAVGRHFGVPPGRMRSALRNFSGRPQRMEIERLAGGIDLINDSYNANPDSMAAALRFLKKIGAGRRRVAILGEMLELGRHAKASHRELGGTAARAGVSLLCVAGPHAADVARGALRGGLPKDRIVTFPSLGPIAPWAARFLRSGDLVLVKGSRGMQMERSLIGLRRRRS